MDLITELAFIYGDELCAYVGTRTALEVAHVNSTVHYTLRAELRAIREIWVDSRPHFSAASFRYGIHTGLECRIGHHIRTLGQ